MSDSDEKKAAYDKMVKEGVPKQDASLMAGYAPGTKDMDKPTKKIQKALEKAGVNDDKLAKVIKDGLEAENRFGSADHNARAKYLGIAGKWLGYEKDALSVQVGLNYQGQVTDPSRLADAIKLVEAEINGRTIIDVTPNNGPEQKA